MHSRSVLVTLSSLAVAFALSACGGGGGGGAPSSTGPSAVVNGLVLARDGSTADLAGIRLRLLPSGRFATTDVRGRFSFGSVPVGTMGIRLASPTAVTTLGDDGEDDDDEGEDRESEGDDHDGGDDLDDDEDGFHHDADGDDDDVGDDDCDFHVGDGGTVEIRIVLENGQIIEVEFSHSTGDLEATMTLVRADTSDDPDVTGFASVEADHDSQEFQIEAQHLDEGRSVTAFAIRGEIVTSFGARIADAEGTAKWEFEDEDLPLGSFDVHDLEGLRLEIRDTDTGTVLLFGEVPDLPPLVGHEDDEARGHARLVAEPGVGGFAEVKLEREFEDGMVENELEVEVEDLALADGTVLNVRLEDPASPGTFATIGTIVVADGEGELELETLPFGATDAGTLTGLHVEIRLASTDALLFAGTLPELVADDD